MNDVAFLDVLFSPNSLVKNAVRPKSPPNKINGLAPVFWNKNEFFNGLLKLRFCPSLPLIFSGSPASGDKQKIPVPFSASRFRMTGCCRNAGRGSCQDSGKTDVMLNEVKHLVLRGSGNSLPTVFCRKLYRFSGTLCVSYCLYPPGVLAFGRKQHPARRHVHKHTDVLMPPLASGLIHPKRKNARV